MKELITGSKGGVYYINDKGSKIYLKSKSKTSGRKTAKKTTKTPTKKVAKKTIKTPTKRISKSPTKKVAKKSTKTPTKRIAKKATKTPTKKIAKTPTKKVTKKATKTPAKSTFKYACDTILPGKILFRGTQHPKKLGPGPWWFTPDYEAARWFADGRGSSGEWVVKKEGWVDKYKTSKKLKLIRLDDIENLIHLRKEIKDKDALIGLGNMVRFFKNEKFYGLHHKDVSDSEIMDADMHRSSTNPGDYNASKWLCDHGYDGFHTKEMKSHGIKTNLPGDMFPEEIVICSPITKVDNLESEWIDIYW